MEQNNILLWYQHIHLIMQQGMSRLLMGLQLVILVMK
jgi:hypothetical protein